MSPGVVVAMSGGVDSSIAAALLVEQGYSVTGIMLRLWHDLVSEEESKVNKNIYDAQSVSEKLGIPFHIIDQTNVFKEKIVHPFIASYVSGETPNPCVLCNPLIKWSTLLNYMGNYEADYVATGHYARIRPVGDGKLQLLKGEDERKDQSYVLAQLTQKLLQHTIFPLGSMKKEKVRSMATKLGLKTAHKEESQDLCFLGQSDYHSFIRRHAQGSVRQGNIINQDGEVIGRHQGLAFYTIGQRKGLGIYAHHPMYVVKKNISSNTLVVGYKEELGDTELMAGPMNWILGSPPSERFEAQVKIRYKASPKDASIKLLDGGFVRVSFEEPLRDITPGQYAVIYDGDVVLGGGKISESIDNIIHGNN